MVLKCARAAAAYVPCVCVGLFHDPDLRAVPRPGESDEDASRRTEHVHAFVVAFPNSWFQYWLGLTPGEFPFATEKRVPLIGDGTVWLFLLDSRGRAWRESGRLSRGVRPGGR